MHKKMASCDDKIVSHLDKKDISQSMRDSKEQNNGIAIEDGTGTNQGDAAWNSGVGGVGSFDSESKEDSHKCIRTNTASTVQSSDDIAAAAGVLPRVLSRCLPRLYRTELIPLDLRFGIVREEGHRVTLEQANHKVIRQAIVKGPKARASVCFVVKRPGCVLCHEQGRAISELMAEFPDNQVAAWAVVKEINVDNEGLLTFYQKYFNFPFFRDPNLTLYSALGNRRVGIVKNPFRIIQRYIEVRKRLQNKGIKGNIIGKGEGMILGGILVFDRKGNIRYAYQEEFTQEAPVDQIRNALRQVIAESLAKRSSGSRASASEFNASPTFVQTQECAVNTIKV